MKKIFTLTILLFIGTSVGCGTVTAPPNDTGFEDANSIQSLVGCYRNLGEGDRLRYLSAIIWPDEGLIHDEIMAINVKYEKKDTLRIIALDNWGIVKEGVFIDGKDFNLSWGQIKVRSKTMTSSAYPAGNVFIGVGHESTILGLDADGNGRMVESTSAAGTAFLVIPIVGNTQDVFRFPRDPSLCKKR